MSGGWRDWWRGLPVTARDVPLALLLAAASFVPGTSGYGTQVGGLPDRPLDLLGAGLVLLQCLPLVVRRRAPALCVGLVAGGFVADQLLGYHTVAGTALPITLLSAGLHLERRRRTVAVTLAVSYVPFAVALSLLGGSETPAEVATFLPAVAVAWVLGAWVRSGRIAEAERRRGLEAASRAAERSRIAAELHDVVTHHVTAMVVQAEAARYLASDPGRLDESLAAVSETGRQAIGDLRHLLDVLDPDHRGPAAPERGDVATLVERLRRAGQVVDLAQEGEPRAAAGAAEAVAYRVVQEALTNAMKHADGARTDVRVRYGSGEIVVDVATDDAGPTTPPSGTEGSGRGLPGLRERVEVLDGAFSAGPADGRFVVRARIPTGETP